MKSGRSFILIILILCSVLALTACSPVEDTRQARALGETWIEHVIAEDEEAAYNMVSDLCSREEFGVLWNHMRGILADSASYDMNPTNWNWKSENGFERSTVIFKVKTDDGKVFQLEITTAEGRDGLIGLYCSEASSVIWSFARNLLWSILSLPLSLAAFALVVLMLIDCAKRPLKNKILWMLIIVIWISLTVTVGGSSFNFNFSFRFPFVLSEIGPDASADSFTVRLAIPVGAIIYFFKRKTLALKDSESASAVENASEEQDDAAE